MADISASLPNLPDILTSIIGGPDVATSTEIRDPPVTVTITVIDTPPTTSIRSTSTSTLTHSTSTTVQNSTSTIPPLSLSTGSTSEPESITTTLITTQGDSVYAIATVIRNPGHVHSNLSGQPGGFFGHRTAVIGVFTAIGILLFASVAGIIACAAHRRAARRRQLEQQEKSQDRRNFFDDEMNDVITPSEKSWWGNTSGASIPYNEMPMHPVGGASNQLADVPDPARVSSAYSGLDSGGTVVHPYASASPSLITASYAESPANHNRNISGTTSTSNISRDAIRSPPPSIPLPALPQIPEGTPPTSSEGWESQIQHRPQNLGAFTPSQESQRSTPLSRNSTKSDFHPYASPQTNRRSELYPGDVLLGLGDGGGVGRSLSGRRDPAPPMPALDAYTGRANAEPKPQLVVSITSPPQQQQHPLDSSLSLAQTHHSLGVSTGTNPSPIEPLRMTPEHATTPTHSRIESGTGLSDGGWYDEDSTSDSGRGAMTGAAASGESMLETSGVNNQNYGYPRRPMQQRVGSANELAETRTPAHDPRFSGLFGNSWANPSDPERDRRTLGSVDESHYTYLRGGNALRVTNE